MKPVIVDKSETILIPSERKQNSFKAFWAFLKREWIIRKYWKVFKNGELAEDAVEFEEYVIAVQRNRRINPKYRAVQRIHDRYFQIRTASKMNIAHRKHSQILNALKSPHAYELIPKGTFEHSVRIETENRLKKELAKIKNDIRVEVESRVKNQLAHEKDNLYATILPFSEGGEGEENDIFVSKDFHRMAAFEQSKKEQELKDFEKRLDYREIEQTLEEKNLGLSGKDLDLTFRENQNNLEGQRLELKAQELENAKQLLLIEVQHNELIHERKLIDLTQIAMDIQNQQKDVELQKKHIEVINLLHDYEMKTREFDMTVTQKLLSIKDEELNVRSLQVDHQIKEAAFDLKHDRSKLEIEGKLLEIKDREFSHKAKEMLFGVEKERHDVENKLKKLDLKEKGVDILFREKNIELDRSYNELVKRENDFAETKMQLAQERQYLINKLTLAEHRAHNAENQVNYVRAGGSGLWSTVAFLYGQRRARQEE